MKIFSVHCSIFWLGFGDDHLFCIHPALPESWVLSWTWNSHVACKVCKMVKSFQDGEKFAKWWKVCKMVKSLENGDRSWKTHHGLLQPKSAAKPSHLEKWLIKLSDSIMFNDLIVIYNCFYITLPLLSLALGWEEMLFREQGEHFRRELLGASVSFPPGNQLQERGLQGETQNRKILQQFSPVQCFRIFILCSLSPASEMESLSHLCRRGCSLSMFEIGRLTASNLRQNFFWVGMVCLLCWKQQVRYRGNLNTLVRHFQLACFQRQVAIINNNSPGEGSLGDCLSIKRVKSITEPSLYVRLDINCYPAGNTLCLTSSTWVMPRWRRRFLMAAASSQTSASFLGDGGMRSPIVEGRPNGGVGEGRGEK